MANNQLMLTPEIQSAFPPAVLEVIRTSLCPTATDPEFLLFAHKAASYGLDPFKNEIFFIKYGNQARIQFAAEAYLSKAREQEGFQPPDTQVVCENDTFKARKVKREDGSDDWEILQHEISFPRGKIIGAYSIAYRDGYRPVTEFVDKEHIAHMYTGQNKDNWNKWEPDMIGKHAQQRALKRQYGLEFGDETIEQPQFDSAPPVRKDITAEANAAAAATTQQVEPPAEEATKSKQDEEAELKKLRVQMKKNFAALGITTPESMQEYTDQYGKFKSETPTLEEVKALLKVMDLHIAEKRQAEQDELPL